MGQLLGHTSFVFGLTNLPTGEIVSASDDCTVRIWENGDCKQVIQHPRTVWAVTTNHLGDLITGCEDYKIRTFTRDFGRREEGDSLRDYENECKAAALGQSNELDVKTLPSVDKISSIKGKKDGEIRVFRKGN
mmetsp:Transcript_23414/g.17850  ORF Transcript_23414/g.17850 Transcript_23414/m.17850 type:complete len:133 (-) Transcript_23414:906-1304(-)